MTSDDVRTHLAKLRRGEDAIDLSRILRSLHAERDALDTAIASMELFALAQNGAKPRRRPPEGTLTAESDIGG